LMAMAITLRKRWHSCTLLSRECSSRAGERAQLCVKK
jgi:hypothetical protein